MKVKKTNKDIKNIPERMICQTHAMFLICATQNQLTKYYEKDQTKATDEHHPRHFIIQSQQGNSNQIDKGKQKKAVCEYLSSHHALPFVKLF